MTRADGPSKNESRLAALLETEAKRKPTASQTAPRAREAFRWSNASQAAGAALDQPRPNAPPPSPCFVWFPHFDRHHKMQESCSFDAN